MNMRVRKGQAMSLDLTDGNQNSYDAGRDARAGGERVERIRVDRIQPSRFQVRRVFEDSEIETLANSIQEAGLIHTPKARPHPDRPGWVELMPGEMRFRAMIRLIERGEAEGILEKDGQGNWLIPVLIEEVDDDRADAIVMRENLDRTDLSPWEWALAFQGRRDRLRARGLPSRVEDLAESWKVGKSQMGDYLKVADAVTHDVLESARVVAGGEPDHRRLARLTLAALARVADARRQYNVDAGAEALLRELDRAGDAAATAYLKERAEERSRPAPSTRGFQLNIRKPLERLEPVQAMHFLGKMVPAVAGLVERVDGRLAEERALLAAQLEAAAARLRKASK